MPDYQMEVDLSVRYRDIDAVGHVNNAVYVSFLEQARVEYLDAVLDITELQPGFLVASVTVDYERPILLDEEVVVSLGVTDIGTASVEMGYEVRADGEVAATASSVIVAVDPETESSRPVPETWREKIAAHEGRTF